MSSYCAGKTQTLLSSLLFNYLSCTTLVSLYTLLFESYRLLLAGAFIVECNGAEMNSFSVDI
jgi:hypothetical protein